MVLPAASWSAGRRHGERPQEGSAEWLDEDALCGECTFVYVDPELLLPEVGFFVSALPSAVEGEREEERRTVPLKDLMSETDITKFNAVTEATLYPDPAPSTWHCTNGWKGNCGQCTITVAEAATLREVLRAQMLHANVWIEAHGGDANQQSLCTAHFADVTVGEDGFIEWENGNCKSTEFEVAPPDNMRLWRLAGTTIGRLMCLLRRASERAYAPGGPGVDSVRREFEALAATVH